MTISEVFHYLNNWFDRDTVHAYGEFTIVDGQISGLSFPSGQYYRIVGSMFNDGVYKHGSESLIDETFDGAVNLMAVPREFDALLTEIAVWDEMYGGADSEAMSPFQSESFAGYSYQKSTGSSSNGSENAPNWKSVYASRLREYKKL